MPTPQVSIIIPVFNKWELTRNCLESLRAHTPEDIEVIVADNASTDDTVTELDRLGSALFGPRFRSIRNRENINFGPACNAGAEAAAAPLLLFLNNDTLLTPGWLPPLLEALERPGTGAVGPLLLYEDRTVQHLGITFSIAGTVSHLYRGFPENHPAVGRKRKLQAITAAALLLRKDLFFEAGSFYPEYRNGFEDVELCARIRQMGLELACVTGSAIFHLEGQSPGRPDHEQHNAALLQERCKDYFYPDLHHHALRDGFRIVINDGLNTSLLVKEERERSLLAEYEGKGIPELFKAVRANPCWLAGHERLAALLCANSAYAEAGYVYARIVNFLPDLEHSQRLREIALKAGDAQLAETAGKNAERLEKLMSDPARYEASIKYFLETAGKRHDRFLSGLYEEKLAAWRRRNR